MKKVKFEEIGYEELEETRYAVEPLYTEDEIGVNPLTCLLLGHEIDENNVFVLTDALFSYLLDVKKAREIQEGIELVEVGEEQPDLFK